MTDRTPTEPTPESERVFLMWAIDCLMEINPSNYDHDDVCAMNSASVEVSLAMQARLSALAASPAAPGAEVAEAIHAARGFDPRDKSISGAGVPYGEWAMTLKIAAAVAPFITGPGAEVEPVAWGEFYGGRCAAVRLDRSVHCQTPLYLSPPPADAIRAQARREALNDAAGYAEGFAAACGSLKLRAREENDVRGAAIHGAAEEEALLIAAGLRSSDLMQGRALAGKGEAEGWRSLDECPSDGQLIWVAGGRYSGDPEIQTADGDWWRSEAKRGSKAVPTVWMPLRVPAPPSAQGGGDGE